MDSTAAVAILLNSELEPSHQYALEALEFKDWLQRDWTVTIKHIYREANHAADYLANLGHNTTRGTHLVDVSNCNLAYFIRYDFANAAIFTLQNRCNTTIWPATLSGRGPLLLNGGTQLLSGESISFFVPNQWSGRFWPRTGCTFDSNTTTAPLKCLTGNCGDGLLECRGTGGVPPATIAEFTLDDVNFYDVSVVDGFNIPISIYPSGGAGNCKKIECFTDLNKRCPKELQVLDGGGRVVACKSACTAYNSPLYCCTEEYGSPEICKPSNFSKIFKDACLSYYSYAFDDATSTFTCGGDPDYLIRFC
ncbi:Pathogenesis-related thaumatin-like protein 3.5 [Linum perenne]